MMKPIGLSPPIAPPEDGEQDGAHQADEDVQQRDPSVFRAARTATEISMAREEKPYGSRKRNNVQPTPGFVSVQIR